MPLRHVGLWGGHDLGTKERRDKKLSGIHQIDFRPHVVALELLLKFFCLFRRKPIATVDKLWLQVLGGEKPDSDFAKEFENRRN